MWFLVSTVDAGLRFSLPQGRDLVVGRKDCDVLIQGDQSISRKHATIHVEGRRTLSAVYLTDCKSKFGTTVNKRKLSANERVELHSNDIIKFGQGPNHSISRFKLIFEPLVFCCSGMERQEKLKVKELAKSLGASLEPAWSSKCTHLVMNTINVTVKVVSALSSCRPIVTPVWLEQAVTCWREGRVLPSCAAFEPEVSDSNIGSGSKEVSFQPDFKRSSLLQDKVFYFLTKKQYTTLQTCVKSAGAVCQLAASSDHPPLQSLLADQSIVLAVDSESLSQLTTEEQNWVEQVNSFLRSQELRPVMDSEIGFALLHKSIENYCNPRSTADSPSVSDHLPPPSLSQQLPLSYLTATNPLPCTQESSQANVTVYAPDTELTQQSLAARQKRRGGDGDGTTSQRDAVTKIDETILLGNKSPKPSAAGGASANVAAKGETLDAMSDIGYGIDDRRFPPAEVKSKLDKKPLLTSIRSFGESSPSSKSHHLKEPPTQHGQQSLESVVEDSQPDSEILTNTVLPGLRKPTVTSLAGNRGGVVAPFSVETNHSLPESDPSILVPSTLTPRSQEKSLPDSGLISTLFKGKRRKRELIHDDGPQESQRESKRSRHVDSDHRREGLKNEQQSMGDPTGAATGASLFSGPRSTRSRGKVKQPERGKTNDDGVGSETKETGTARLHHSVMAVRNKAGPETEEERDEASLAATSKNVDKSLSLSTPRTPKKRPREDHSSTSPFLSTRKHRKVEAIIIGPPTNEDDANATTNTSTLGTAAASLTDNPATLSCTQHTQNTSKLATGTGLVTPFTCLTFPVGVVCSTGGKRTKASTSTNADIWNDDNTMLGRGEGEDPLGFQEPPRKNYKPVCTEDGFILARSKPKLQVSRLQRLGLLSSGSGGGVHGEGEESSAPTALVDITFVSLVAGRGRRRGVDDGSEEEEAAQTAVKNFKKFRKVRHTDGGIPRILSLVQYVPSANQELPDWDVDVRGVDERNSRTEESSQDLFQFTLRPKRKRTVP